MPHPAGVGTTSPATQTTAGLVFDMTRLVLVDVQPPAVRLVPGHFLPPVAAAPEQEDDDHRAGARHRSRGGHGRLPGEPGRGLSGELRRIKLVRSGQVSSQLVTPYLLAVFAGPGPPLCRLYTDRVGRVWLEAGQQAGVVRDQPGDDWD